LGYFDPLAEAGGDTLRVDIERADFWLARGAQPSERVRALLKRYRKTAVAAAAAD
ncbi:MAG: 30S ribosomal protein S16, partial [Pseudomonadota bacterium]